MSRPVTYLSWSVVSTDGKPHQVDLLLDVDPVIGVNDPSEQVTWSRSHTNGLTVLGPQAPAIRHISTVAATASELTGDTFISPFPTLRTLQQSCQPTPWRSSRKRETSQTPMI